MLVEVSGLRKIFLMDVIGCTCGKMPHPMLERLETSAFSQWVVGSDSLLAYPTILTLHTVGLALVVGAAVVVDLRTLGVGEAIPLEVLRHAYRVFWSGFAINLVSGLVLFASEATTKGVQPVFYIKLTLIAAALVITSVIRRRTLTPRGSAGTAASARPLAIASLTLWGAAIIAGRLMAYL
jgi:hypothetical protein